MTNIAVVLPDSYSKVIVIFSISMRPCICEEVYSEILKYLSKTPPQFKLNILYKMGYYMRKVHVWKVARSSQYLARTEMKQTDVVSRGWLYTLSTCE